MTRCAIVVLDAAAIKTLAFAGKLDLLLKPGIPVLIPDVVITALEELKGPSGDPLASDFIRLNSGKGIQEIQTGVPAIAALLNALGEDPGDISIKMVIDKYDDIK